MSLRSLWTPEAEFALLETADYLEGEWGEVVAEAFVSNVAHTVALLEVFPLGGVLEVPDLCIRSIPVARQVRLFYRVEPGVIIILELIDTRTSRFQRLRE